MQHREIETSISVGRAPLPIDGEWSHRNSIVAGYDIRFVPLHYYGTQALNLMWNHLRTGAALPASQVVRAIPRGGTAGAALPITTANVPPIVLTPAAADVINFNGTTNTVQIPN